jgi:hypothetical protein
VRSFPYELKAGPATTRRSPGNRPHPHHQVQPKQSRRRPAGQRVGSALGIGNAQGKSGLGTGLGSGLVITTAAATPTPAAINAGAVEREWRLRAVTRVAEVAQRALLGGVPPALGSLRLAVLGGFNWSSQHRLLLTGSRVAREAPRRGSASSRSCGVGR